MLLLVAIVSALFWQPPSLAADSAESAGLPFQLQHVSVVSADQLEELKMLPHVTAVYFFVKNSGDITTFLQEYDQSAKDLKSYSITLALHECNSGKSAHHDMCNKENVEHNVSTYQNGSKLLTLPLDAMFDVNSIMANLLQLAMLHKVPIIESSQELDNLQRSAVGKNNIFLAYGSVLGTKEHLTFLEVAYVFHPVYKFALTTELEVVQHLRNGDQHKTKRSAVFVLFCAEFTADTSMPLDGICSVDTYRGEYSFPALLHYVANHAEKTVYYSPGDGLLEVFDGLDDSPVVFLYLDDLVVSQGKPVIEMAKLELRGLAKLVVVDINVDNCRTIALQQGFPGRLPAIAVKKGGVITFMDQADEWSVDAVLKFVRSMVFPPDDELTPGCDPSRPCHDKYSPVNHYTEFVDEVQRQDDQVAAAVLRLSQEEMQLEHAPALLKASFYKSVAQVHLKMVLFYLPFDHVSMAFLREFGRAAQVLTMNLSEPNVMAVVNCYDGTDLCAAENITTYPLVRIYRQGQGSQDYLGSLDAKSVIKAVKLLRLNTPVQLTNTQDAEQFLKGEHPHSFHNFTASSVLLLTSTMDTDEEQIFNTVAKTLSIITAFGIIHGEVSTSIAKVYNLPVPSVMSIHRRDPNKPIRSLNEPLSHSSLVTFVKESIVASLPELNVINFPTLFARKQPFAILFLDTTDPGWKSAMDTFTQVAMFGRVGQIIFCWMNARAKTTYRRIMLEYTSKVMLPMITVVDHQSAEVFNFQSEEFTMEGISDWLIDVMAKKVQPSKMLKDVKWLPPGPHYDFLARIDEMEENKKNKKMQDKHLERELPARDPPLHAPPLAKEEFGVDSELQEDRSEPRNSRIYHQSPNQPAGTRNHHLKDRDSSSTHTHHHHVEL